MALIVLVDKIMSALDNGYFVLFFCIDLSKPFDTVNHNTNAYCWTNYINTALLGVYVMIG